jgi:prepilin-type N-terminal cleavage/methylation domain-containing protein
MNKQISYNGFTLVELIIVVVIISVLAVLSVPIYRGYVRQAMATEGITFANSVIKAETAYFVEHGIYYDTTDLGDTIISCPELGLDSSGMNYFEKWKSCCCDPAYAYNIYVYGKENTDGKDMVVRLYRGWNGYNTLEITY